VILLVGAATILVTVITLFNTLVLAPSTRSLQALNSSLTSSSASSLAAQIAAFNTIFIGSNQNPILGFIVTLAHALLISSPLVYMASERFMGRTATLGETYRAVIGRWWRLGIALAIFYGLFDGLLFILPFIAALCGAGFGILIFVGVGLYPFIMPVFVLERTGIVQGLSRAWFLAKSRFWPLLGVSVAIYLISFLVQLGLYVIEFVVIGNLLSAASLTTITIIRTLIQAVIGIFVAPLLPFTYTMMYYDTRIRVEGLDIALQSLDTADPRPNALTSPPAGKFMSSQDWRNAGLLALGGVVFFILIFAGIAALIGYSMRNF
jgi:hypothetical protein